MTIQEAIKQRIERFNRLWIKAVGYSFEDEVEVMRKERDNAVNKASQLRPPKGGRLSKGCHPLAWHVDECSY